MKQEITDVFEEIKDLPNKSKEEASQVLMLAADLLTNKDGEFSLTDEDKELTIGSAVIALGIISFQEVLDLETCVKKAIVSYE